MATPTVLIVEDDKDVRMMYERFFTLEKFKTVTADDGNAAIDHARRERPDIILMDIMMPNLDGISALKALKSDSETRDLKVVMLSNLSDKETQDACTAGGAIGFMVKVEFSPHEVIGKVREYLAA